MTVADLLAGGSRLDLDFAIEVIRGCCEAGTELGDLRWSSRAIGVAWSPTPASIEVSSTRAVRLLPHDASPISFAYFAPEVADGLHWDERGWVFALGAILYEMLAGAPLFRGSTDYATVEAVRRARVLPPHDMPVAPSAIVMKALARNPAARYQTLGDLADALAAAATTCPATAPYR